MNPLRILAAATAIELCFLALGMSALCLAGASYGWLDALNAGCPLILPVALLGAAMSWIFPKGRLRTVCVATAAIAALVPLGMLAPEAAHSFAQKKSALGPAYRIVDANTFRENTSPFGASHALATSGADALLLQEDDTLLKARSVIAAAYPFSAACPDTGVALWLKTPILDRGCGLPMPLGTLPDWGKEFIWVKTEGPGGKPIILASVHLGRPYPPQRQAIERRALAKALSRLPQDRLVLAGDFNTAPWTFAMFAQDRAFHPLRRLTLFWPTWPARVNLLSRPWPWPILPIDHLYAGPSWGSVKMARLPVKGSDHIATRFDLDLAR